MLFDIEHLKYGDAVDPLAKDVEIKTRCLERLHDEIEKEKDQLTALMSKT